MTDSRKAWKTVTNITEELIAVTCAIIETGRRAAKVDRWWCCFLFTVDSRETLRAVANIAEELIAVTCTIIETGRRAAKVDRWWSS